MNIIEIDGAQGEGGGQVLRTTLSMSACLGQPVRIRHIRQGRKKPGLMRQHLACVHAATKICNAQVKGASLGSTRLYFVPGEILAGEYRFSIGSAGSTTLVFQTVLPILLMAKKSSRLILQGGTHNPMAPSFDFVQKVFLPVLQQSGVHCTAVIERYGFYPVGGGCWQTAIAVPEKFDRIKIEQHGRLIYSGAKCLGAGIPAHVMVREKKKLLEKLNWSEKQVQVQNVTAIGAGNVVSIHAGYECINEVIDSIGSVGIRAENVALKAVESLRVYQNIGAPVGEHLADQLLLPMAVMAGGSYITGPLSQHTLTNIEVIRQISDVKIQVEQIQSKSKWRITVKR